MNAAAAPRHKEALASLDLAATDAERYAKDNAERLAEARAIYEALAALAARSDAPAGRTEHDATAALVQFDALAQRIDRAVSHAGLMRNVHPNAALRAAADAAEQAWSKLTTELGLSRPVYDALRATDGKQLDATGQRYLAHALRDFRRSGVDRSEAERHQVRALKEELVRVGQAFDQHIREDVRTLSFAPGSLDGLPADYVAAHPAHKDDGKVRISTDYPDYIPFMSYAKDDDARRKMYVAFRQRSYPKNEAVLLQLLRKRQALAKALGYASWADYITEDKMIGSAGAAQKFIDRVDELATVRAHKDAEGLLFALRRTQPKATAVQDWQKGYLEEEERRTRYALDSQTLRSYFPFSRVRDGILDVTAQMFGVRYERVEADAWHPAVEAYDLYQGREGKERIGRFYLDLHPRGQKYKHAAAFPIQAGFVDGETTQLPVAALVCNFPAGADALLEHDDVTTFFHEFGHLLHHLFAGRGRWVGQSGIATEWDFVEAPSQMLEEWSFDAEVLQRFAKNAAGEAITPELVESLRRARNLGRGLWVKQQMFYAALSLGLHHEDPNGPVLQNTDALVQRLQAHYAPFPHVDGTHFQLSFGHLEGYSAMYYTYMWSLSIAKDLFGVFTRAPSLLSPEVAGRYRQAILAPGGSKDAGELVTDFLGRPFAFDAFAHWVNAVD